MVTSWIFFNINFFKLLLFFNLDERSAIGWIERWTKLRNFSDFYFLSYGNFCDVITRIFNDNSKNKNRRIFFLFIPFYSAHSPHLIKFRTFLRGGVCMSVTSTQLEKPNFRFLFLEFWSFLFKKSSVFDEFFAKTLKIKNGDFFLLFW